MLLYNALVVLFIEIITVQSLIPTLTVRKLDKKLIDRKRQDTLDICHIFNTENEKLKSISDKYKQPNNNQKYISGSRVKREIGAKLDNPSLNSKDIKRVENIVDKLYEDLQEKDVTYRQKDLSSLTTAKPLDIKNKTLRRFNFAPAELVNSYNDQKKPYNSPPETVDVPWPKKWKHAIIPYYIDSNTYDLHLSEEINKAFSYFEKATCIRLQKLRERPTDKYSLQNVEWLYITNPTGIRQCVHSNERKENKGVQMVVFGYDCLSRGQIVHEVMHVLGFSHENTRPDRDQFITVLWDNIKPGYKKYFEIHEENTVMNIPYDFESILHYPSRAFSKNGKVTILTEGAVQIGQREGLSEYDIEKINMIFGHECVNRNKDYLLTTCPRAVRADTSIQNVTQEDIEEYFKNRLWPFGIINYQLRDKLEFSVEERQNIEAVIRHIEKETCLEFRDLSANTNDEENNVNANKQNNNDNVPTKKDNIESMGESEIKNQDKRQPTSDSNEVIDKTKEIENKIDADTDNNGIQSETKELESVNADDVNTVTDDEITLRSNKNNNPIKNAKKNVSQKNTNGKSKRVRRAAKQPLLSSRRHADNIITLTRSPTPGCLCPSPGRPNGNIQIKINADCFNSINDLLHYFVHILGLDHQHNMYDRDSYLHILWDNLSPEVKKEMQKRLPPAASVGFSYDYQSVMHYPWLEIKDGQTNIMYPVWNDGWAMGHWQGLSSVDVQKLNLLYFRECQERKKQTQVAINSLRH